MFSISRAVSLVQYKSMCILPKYALIKIKNDTEVGKGFLLIKFGRDPTSKKSGLY